MVEVLDDVEVVDLDVVVVVLVVAVLAPVPANTIISPTMFGW